jgi:hypothetical protein
MAFSFFSKTADPRKSADELALVLDIESGLVRGSLVLFSGTASEVPKLPHVLHTVSSEILTHSEGNSRTGGVRILSSMLDAVASVTEHISHQGLKITSAQSIKIPISKIHLVFSSPWIISKTKTVKVSYEKETKITKASIMEIVDKERQELEKRFVAENDTNLEFDLAFIEQKIFEIKLNGYPTEHFENKETREFEVSFVTSISSKNILSRIEKTIEKSIRMNQRNVECHSSLLLQYFALRTVFPGKNDYMVIHVHHEISDIIVVKNGVCSVMASFPSGIATFSHTSAALLKLSQEVSDSSLNLHSKKALHPAESHRIETAAKSSLASWAGQFTDTIASLGEGNSIPHRVYLLANAHYAYFEKALTGMEKHFNVAPIEKGILDSYLTHANKEKEDALMSMYIFSLK